MENIFDTSFLIKDSMLWFFLDQGVPMISFIDGLGNARKSLNGEIERIDQQSAVQTQCVSSITPSQHRVRFCA